MKVLILTGKFGMGHYSVAEALKNQLKKKYNDVDIEIVDLMEYLLPKSNQLIYNSFHLLVSRYHNVYNKLNGYASEHSDVPVKKVVTNRLSKLIETYKADIIISTFPGCSQYVSYYIENNKTNIKLYTYVTDMDVHNEWIADNTDAYFVGSDITKNMLLSKGIEEEKIILSGLPVKELFKSDEIIKREGDRKNILILGGGLGLIPEFDILIKALLSEKNINITVIAGKNKKLFKTIKNNYPEVEAISFTNNIDKYMKNADLIITKAG